MCVSVCVCVCVCVSRIPVWLVPKNTLYKEGCITDIAHTHAHTLTHTPTHTHTHPHTPTTHTHTQTQTRSESRPVVKVKATRMREVEKECTKDLAQASCERERLKWYTKCAIGCNLACIHDCLSIVGNLQHKKFHNDLRRHSVAYVPLSHRQRKNSKAASEYTHAQQTKTVGSSTSAIAH